MPSFSLNVSSYSRTPPAIVLIIGCHSPFSMSLFTLPFTSVLFTAIISNLTVYLSSFSSSGWINLYSYLLSQSFDYRVFPFPQRSKINLLLSDGILPLSHCLSSLHFLVSLQSDSTRTCCSVASRGQRHPRTECTRSVHHTKATITRRRFRYHTASLAEITQLSVSDKLTCDNSGGTRDGITVVFAHMRD